MALLRLLTESSLREGLTPRTMHSQARSRSPNGARSLLLRRLDAARLADRWRRAAGVGGGLFGGWGGLLGSGGTHNVGGVRLCLDDTRTGAVSRLAELCVHRIH